MSSYSAPLNKQTGVMLLEALISILIFSLGILAIVGLQAAAVSNAADAKYRTDASLLANEVIAQMWNSNRDTTATVNGVPPLPTNFSSSGTGGAGYNNWINTTICPASAPPALPGIDCVNKVNMPTIAISAVTATITPTNRVTVSLSWQAPGTVTPHKYVAVAQISKAQ